MLYAKVCVDTTAQLTQDFGDCRLRAEAWQALKKESRRKKDGKMRVGRGQRLNRLCRALESLDSREGRGFSIEANASFFQVFQYRRPVHGSKNINASLVLLSILMIAFATNP